ncbi:MAG TPA: hypothetical protein VIF43_03205 [Patescibacteria group bacterium]|jgi:hypothetical protein
MPTVEKKYTQDVYEGRHEYGGNHDVYEMPDKAKPHGRVHTSPRVIMTILILLLFIIGLSVVIFEIIKQSRGFA